jgi:hypothetical protein
MPRVDVASEAFGAMAAAPDTVSRLAARRSLAGGDTGVGIAAIGAIHRVRLVLL